jgi:hypothetical protein
MICCRPGVRACMEESGTTNGTIDDQHLAMTTTTGTTVPD